MKRKNNFSFSYPSLDSQRVREAFFSPPQRRKSPKIFFTLTVVFLAGSALFLFLSSHYDFIIIPHKISAGKDNSLSLLSKEALYSLTFLKGDKHLIKSKGKAVYLTLLPEETVNIKLRLKQPINLNSGYLAFYLKKSSLPLRIVVVLRDIHFFSNSRKPVVVEVAKPNSSFIKVPLRLEKLSLQNTHLSRINYINLSFNTLSRKEPGWVFIKDLILVKRD